MVRYCVCCACNSPVGFTDVQFAWLRRIHVVHTGKHCRVRWRLLRMRKALRRPRTSHSRYQQRYVIFFSLCTLLGPFHGAIAVPSVTRCCCRRCRWRRGHRCAGGARQYRWRHLVNGREAARSSEWAQHFSNASCYSILPAV